MPIVREYRIVLPLSLEEYRIGQLWAVMEQSKRITGGGEGVEWHENHPFENHPLFGGQYTHGQFTRKTYHVKNKIPRLIRTFISEKSLKLEEKAYNAYPYCRVELIPGMTPEKFDVYIESMHIADRSESENVFSLPNEMLKKREVYHINIVSDPVAGSDYRPAEDPSRFRSKSGRGPWRGAAWQKTCEPFMCCYKLVHVECNWMSGRMVESLMAKQYPRMSNIFHRLVVCSIDKWEDLEIEDIRQMETETIEYLNQHLNQGHVQGPAPLE